MFKGAIGAPTASITMPLRVANMVINPSNDDDDDEDTTHCNQGAIPTGTVGLLFFRVLDLCAAAEHQARLCFGSDDIPAALVTVDVNMDVGGESENVPIFGPLTTNYSTLVRSLQVLKIANNEYDESVALGAFAALATQLLELTFNECGLTSVRGMEERCEYLQKAAFTCCSRLATLAGLERRVCLKEVDASGTAITSIAELLMCPALTKVDLYWCQQLTTLEGLGHHAWLQEVNASNTAITSVEVLLTCPALRCVELHACRHLESLEGLQGHKWLEEVHASQTPITSVEPLQTCSALTRVDLYSCQRLPADINLPAGVDVTLPVHGRIV